jgi:trk system potassium uptake protein
MYVVVAGAGQVGYHVARALRLEGHNVALIDSSPKAIEAAMDLDALIIEGNAGSMEVLEKADIKKADLFIGATGNDEANMIACTMAKSYGVATLARLNDPAYLDETASTKYKNIGIDVAVCPELVAASKIANIILAPTLASADIFVHGKVALVETKVAPGAQVAGKKIKVIKPPAGIQLVAILRSDQIIIPRGEDTLEVGDRLLMVALTPESLKEAEQILGLKSADTAGKVEKVVVAGATRIGIRLAKLLENKVDVVLIEKDPVLCTMAFERLKKTLVIQGDATDTHLLEQEGATSADAFVGAAKVEEYNILACLILHNLGVKRTIAMVNQPQLKALVEDIGINLAINTRQAVVSSLLKWTYDVEATDLAIVAGGEARAMEVKLKSNSSLVGKPLKKIEFPHDSVVAAVVRKDEVLLPRGDDVLEAGDRLVIVALNEAIGKIERLLKK